ncbi:Arm DNA-binding domain-containing protein [Paraburkholderia xenovorans]|jgi:hypothetical protein
MRQIGLYPRIPTESPCFGHKFEYIFGSVPKRSRFAAIPRLADPLSALAVERAKPKADEYSLADGNGLSLKVSPNGAKSWSVRYRLLSGGRRNVVIGHYPTAGLAEAREKTKGVHQAARAGQ